MTIESLILNDFSAGWCPSDDPINGRRNSLLAMENVTLDVNGTLRSSGGTVRKLTVFTNTLHSLYSKVINGTNYIYSADTAGVVFRNNTSIATSGSTTRACFNSAYNYVFGFSGNKRIKDTGAATTDLGIIKPSAAPTLATGAAGVLTGDYEYCQINVLVNGTYQAKSARGTIGTLTLTAQIATVTPQDPATPGSTANEAWIFRRGVNLDTWYRIARVTTFGSFSDNMSDSDALLLGITMNDYLLSVNSTDTPDAIIAVVGPIYGRHIYFTSKQIIPSDRYSPDSYDSRTVMGLGGASGAETFKWAIKVAKNTILIGTDLDVYILSGTWVQLPDGFLDVSLDPLGVSDPPIGTDVTLYKKYAVYMSKIGWVACDTSGAITSLVFPNTDFIYNGGKTYEYGAVTIDTTGATRYPCCVSREKLYTIESVGTNLSGTGATTHMEIYEFNRKYWRVAYPGLTPKMLYTMEDGSVIGFDNTDKFVKQYDTPETFTLGDGSSTRQSINVVSPVYDNSKPNNLKEFLSLELAGGTNSSLHGVVVTLNTAGHVGSDCILSTIFLLDNTGYYSIEKLVEIRNPSDPSTPIISKTLQFIISGTPNKLTLQRLQFYYDLKPESHVLLRLLDLGIDSVNKKRVHALSFIIDTHGSDVTFTTVTDIGEGGTNFNTSGRELVTCYFIDNAFTKLYGCLFEASNNVPFELYQVLPPTVVQTLPEAKPFDQVGPIELFRYGKLKEIELRLIASTFGSGSDSIPYTVFFEDTSVLTGDLTVEDAKEEVYVISVPKTIAGTILRIELGIANFNFIRLGTRIKVATSGNETELKWVNIP